MKKSKKKTWTIVSKFLWAFFWVSLAILLTVFMILSVRYVYTFCHDFFAEKVSVDRVYEVEFVIPEGENAATTARRLENKGLIKNRFLFLAQLKFYDRTLNIGHFTLRNDMTTREVLTVLSSDDSNG